MSDRTTIIVRGVFALIAIVAICVLPLTPLIVATVLTLFGYNYGPGWYE